MNKLKVLLIGTAVLAIGLAVIFWLNSRKSNQQLAELQSISSVESKTETVLLGGNSPMDAPMMVAQTDIMPGLYFEGTYLDKNKWINNPDGTVSYDGHTYKRNAHVKAILLAGIDHKNGMQEKKETGDTGAADGIMLVAQDTNKNTLKMLMIPRDCMLEYLMTSETGEVFSKFDHLNVSFENGDGRHESAKSLAKAVSDLLCGLNINHYLVGDLKLLAEVNDMVGGVTVTIPGDEPAKKNPKWIKGKQVTLHGDEAEAFIRYRDTNIDGSSVLRMNQHKEYVSGFFKTLKEKSRTDSSIVSKLTDKIDTSLITDMSKGEYEKIALDGLQGNFNPSEDITSLPGTLTTGETNGEIYDEVYPDYTQTIPILLELFYRKIE